MNITHKRYLLLTVSIIFSLSILGLIVYVPAIGRIIVGDSKYEEKINDLIIEKYNITSEYIVDACKMLDDRLQENKKNSFNLSNAYTCEGINSDGFRDYQYSLEKNENTFRIIIIGSSWSEYGGNKMQNLFSKQLEKLLNSKSNNIKYEVINQALGGTYFSTKLCTLKNYSQKYSPDLILFKSRDYDPIDAFLLNERLMYKVLNDEIITQEDLVSADLNLFDIMISRQFQKAENGKILSNERMMAQYIKNLQEFKKITEKNNIQIRSFFVPTSYFEKPSAVTLRIQEIFQKNNIRYFDFFNLINSNIRERFFFTNDAHPSPFGHKIIAILLFNELITEKILPNWEELNQINISNIELNNNQYYERNDDIICQNITSQK